MINSMLQWNGTGKSTMWILFLCAAFLVFFLAIKLVKYGNGVILKTKFGGAFVGGVLISITTSLPEVITEITQGAAGNPVVGLSDDIGANAFSTFAISVVCIFAYKTMFIEKLTKWTKTLIIISFLCSLSMIAATYFGHDLTLGINGKFAIGLIPLVFLGVYLMTIIGAYKQEEVDEHEGDAPSDMTAKKAIIGFFIFSILLIFGALILNWIVDVSKRAYSIDDNTAGGIFLSMTTAMPEVVALVGFYKKKQFSAAISSIAGSHIFNLSAIIYGDLAYKDRALLTSPDISGVTPIAILVSIMLCSLIAYIFIIKLFKTKKQKKVFNLIASSFIATTYIVGWVIILALF